MKAFDSAHSRLRLVTAAAIVFSVALMILLTAVPVANNNLWTLMKVGEIIVDTGRIPETLLFPFTTVRDNHFNAHEWLASVFFHELDRMVGLRNLMWVVSLFAVAQFALCVALAKRRSASLGAALLLALLAMICANARYVLRPEMIALLLLVLLLLVLHRYQAQRRWPVLAWTLILEVVWANCHGSFLLGPAIVGIFALGEGLTASRAASGTLALRLRQGWSAGWPYAVTMLAMIAVCVANPGGWKLLAFPFQLQDSKVMRELIGEWLPTFSPRFMIERAFLIFALVGLAAVLLMARLRRFLGATDALLFLFFAALALDRSRHIVWFGFIAMTVCARLLGHVEISPRRELQLRCAAAAFAAAGLFADMRLGNAVGARISYSPSDNFSAAMVTELASPTMTGNVMNSYELGSELIYRDWPRLKPSIDTRVDSYGVDYLLFSIRLLQDEKLLNLFLEANRVEHMLLLKRDFELGVRRMPSIRANWHVQLTDGDIFLLDRNVPLPSAAASRAAP